MAEREPLSPSQAKLLEFLRAELRARRGVPSWPKIARACGWSSTRSVGYNLDQLARRGHLRLTGGPGGIELVGAPAGFTLPVLGDVAAGAPIPPPGDGEPEHFEFERVFGGEDVFMLRVRGDSMIEALIGPGDLVAVRRAPEAADGEKVVAMIDGELTLKVFRQRAGGAIWLQPCNSKLAGIKLDPKKDNRVIGVLVGVVRAGN
ncbi:LexA repressor [Gemmata sp. SH-PL17]|uniref:transcriptional repressor LexA n=1 Tax=Gemmata sp. SH-PL17 TaxID=1630693 RepID=UPI00078E6311|nr:transcriptional repressor LexA [Gemmata sp. SH-PL17]AMV27534.1 LexA repressor [Gemmata sp. SH-PL17]